MDEILAQQRNTPKPMTGKHFFLGILKVILCLAGMQAAVNLLIAWTGIGLLNIVFYLFAVWLLVRFMTFTVAGSLYMLKKNALYLQKTLGDSTVSVVEIPLENVLSVRPVVCGERLQCCYRRVTVVDAGAAVPFRMRLASLTALFSARLARRAAGNTAEQPRGYAVAYLEEGKRSACVFLPDQAFLDALESALGEKVGKNDREDADVPVTMMAQALKRAFPQLYTHVTPLLSEERLARAEKEIEAQKLAREAKAADRRKKREKAEDDDEVQDDTL